MTTNQTIYGVPRGLLEEIATCIGSHVTWPCVVELRAMLEAAPAPPQPIYDEAKERQLFEDSMIEASEEAGFGEPDLYRDSGGCYRQTYHQAAWGGWLACAQSRAKAVEVDHE